MNRFNKYPLNHIKWNIKILCKHSNHFLTSQQFFQTAIKPENTNPSSRFIIDEAPTWSSISLDKKSLPNSTTSNEQANSDLKTKLHSFESTLRNNAKSQGYKTIYSMKNYAEENFERNDVWKMQDKRDVTKDQKSTIPLDAKLIVLFKSLQTLAYQRKIVEIDQLLKRVELLCQPHRQDLFKLFFYKSWSLMMETLQYSNHLTFINLDLKYQIFLKWYNRYYDMKGPPMEEGDIYRLNLCIGNFGALSVAIDQYKRAIIPHKDSCGKYKYNPKISFIELYYAIMRAAQVKASKGHPKEELRQSILRIVNWTLQAMKSHYPDKVFNEPTLAMEKGYPDLPDHPMQFDETIYSHWLQTLILCGLHKEAIKTFFLNLSYCTGDNAPDKNNLIFQIISRLRDPNAFVMLFNKLNDDLNGMKLSDLSIRCLNVLFSRITAILKDG